MGKREGPPLHSAMNVISSLLLCLTLGRLFFVLRPPGSTRSSDSNGVNRVPNWLPTPPQPEKRYPNVQGPTQQQENRHNKAASQSVAYSAGRRGEVMPEELQMQLSNSLRRGSGVGDYYLKFGDGQRSTTRLGNRRASGGGSSSSSSDSNNRVTAGTYTWGQGMRVLIFTMDSIQDAVAKSKRGGAAGEIIVRESLTNALTEAGVQVRCVIIA